MDHSDSHAAHRHRLRLLIADDNIDASDGLATLLRLSGYEVTTAYCGKRALELALELKPQVAILDIGMPDLSGYEVAHGIRAQPWGDKVKLIALTGWGQEHDIQRAHDAGFDHHFRKPADAEEIAAYIDGRR